MGQKWSKAQHKKYSLTMQEKRAKRNGAKVSYSLDEGATWKEVPATLQTTVTILAKWDREANEVFHALPFEKKAALLAKMEKKVMPIYAKRKEYEIPKEGLHPGVCVDVVDLGVIETGFGPKVKVKIVWQLAEVNKKGYRFLVSKRYTPSLYKGKGKKSNLRTDLESWRGKQFSADEEKQFDIEKLLGANCQLAITHNITDETTYANVSAVVPPAKNAEKLFAENYEREIHREGYVAPQQPEPEPDEPDAFGPADDEEVPF